MQRFLSLLLTLATAALTGCASAPPMPLADNAPKLDESKALYLMSVTIRNDQSPRWQPRVLNVFLDREDSAGKPESMVFVMDEKGAVPSKGDGDSKTYLVRFSAEPIPLVIRGFTSMASAFPVHAFYFVPLHAALPRQDKGVFYLGAVKAAIRERKEGEFRAGPLIPLIDQAVAGASTGTFDIEITDAYATDIELFKSTFPSLKDVDVRNAVLPKWDRPKAQLFWEKS